MKKLSNTEAELKKSVAYEKKACNLFFISTALTGMLKYQYFACIVYSSNSFRIQ